jgi:hypothetical protein
VQHEVAIGLMRRALTLIETQTPELADRHMRVPLDYYGDPDLAAKEKALFETSPLAIMSSATLSAVRC